METKGGTSLKTQYTAEEKRILRGGIATILWKVVFGISSLWELMVVITTLPKWSEYAVVFWIFTIPYLFIFYFAFRKQLFWNDEKKRTYIQKIQARKNANATAPRVQSVKVTESHEYMQNAVNNTEHQAMEASRVEEPIYQPKERKAAPSVIVKISTEVKYDKEQSDIPPLQGEYAKAVFLWAFRKPSAVRSKDQYPGYFLYECGIRDCVEYHKQLIQEGYFEKASTSEMLDAFKVPELKNMLLELEQPVSGKKADLISRILTNADESFINEHVTETLFKLSDKGEGFLKEHQSYAEIHKHKNWDVDWKEYDANAKDGEEYLSVMWRIFNQKVKNCSINEGRNIYLNMYQLTREKGNMSDALELLLKVFYIDLSGVEGMSMYDLYHQNLYTKKDLKEHFMVSVMVPPGNIASLREFENVYDSDMIDQLFAWKLPLNICSIDLFREIIESGIYGIFDEEITEKKLQTAYNKYVDSI